MSNLIQFWFGNGLNVVFINAQMRILTIHLITLTFSIFLLASPNNLQQSDCNITNCLECSNNPYYCYTCIDNFYVSGPVQCSQCSDVKCKVCPGNLCIDCQSEYYFDNNTNLCQLCSSINCKTCKTNITNELCIQCLDTYTLNNGSCYPCPIQFCQNCPNNKCTICLYDYYLLYNEINQTYCQPCYSMFCQVCHSNGTCTQCLAGYYNVSGKCVQCIDKNCNLCDGNGLCLVCQDNFYAGNGSCRSCSDFNCSVCSSFNVCSHCMAGFYLNKNSICQQCSTIHCQSCITQVCALCEPLYYLTQLNQAIICQSCMELNCSVCTSDSICSDCLSGYYLTKQNQCKSCSVGNCLTCYNNICTDCFQGYFITQNASNLSQPLYCQPCSVQNCSKCQSNGICQICKQNYYLIDHQCKACPFSNCKVCFQNLSKCLICSDNYYYHENGCQPCLNRNCSTCSSDGTCSTCLSNYLPTQNGCQICTIQFCNICQTLQICKQCDISYTWNASSMKCQVTYTTPWWFWVLLGLAGLVIVTGVGCLVMRWWNQHYELYAQEGSGVNYVELKNAESKK